MPERTLQRALGLRPRRVAGRLWYLTPGDRRRQGLGHDNALLKAVLALRGSGVPPFSFMVEPRLLYLSPAAGQSFLAPDIYLCVRPGWFLEVDMGTERHAQLYHKLLRYKEWFWVKGQTARLAMVCAPGRVGSLRSLAAEVGLSPVVAGGLDELVFHITR